ncbi:poly(beta-D-mannuronate) lyase [Devosia sp. UYZn731]|uniref:alginate lyase family protein n=1 Tax=Devosia sp. UYZn731 TaxID=3156345 RepID=UPI00339503FE
MNFVRKLGMLVVALAVAGAIGNPLASGQEAAATEPAFTCPAAPDAVVSLSIGSRYQNNSATRSEISQESNDDVNKALEPVETFINDLSKMANVAYLDEPDGQEEADCTMAWLHSWANGGALTELNSLNARLAISPRLAGMGLAYLQAKDKASPNPERDKVIVDWFEKQGTAVITFFSTEAGPLANRNNLRAWAGLAMASIGKITGDEKTQAWARDSYKALVCGAEDSGALPAEMERGERALHYQLHALAPLAVTIGLIDPDGLADDELCRTKLISIAEFTFAAVKDPAIVADLVGKQQVFSGDGESELASYQMAWAEPYLKRYSNAMLEDYVAPLRPLKYSKLGGNLSAIYGQKLPPSE